ncbi:unnamed protein product [Amaranthus hypochondriacus]
MLDFINGRKMFSESIHDIATCLFEVCRAEHPEKEIAAWKVLAKEIHHRLHSDESVFKISKMIFGDRMVPWIMSPPKAIYMADSHIEDCVSRLSYIFVEHCGVWYSFGLKYLQNFYAMCTLGVRDDEFAKAAEETCRGYVYTLNSNLY